MQGTGPLARNVQAIQVLGAYIRRGSPKVRGDETSLARRTAPPLNKEPNAKLTLNTTRPRHRPEPAARRILLLEALQQRRQNRRLPVPHPRPRLPRPQIGRAHV